MFLLMVSNPDGARRRVIEEETQNMLEKGEKNGFTRELYPTSLPHPHSKAGSRSCVNRLPNVDGQPRASRSAVMPDWARTKLLM